MHSRARGVNCKKKQLLPLEPNMLHSQAIRIRTHRGESIWSLLKNYVNGLDTNSIFNRNDLLSCVYVNEVVKPITSCQTTVDQYKRYLVLADVVESAGWGEYRKLKNIPEHLSIKKLQKHVYSHDWRTWFIKIEDL
jgi:hypothetical protein